jgi:hypothetical protein
MRTDQVMPRKGASQDQDIDQGQDKSQESIEEEVSLREVDTDITRNTEDIIEIDLEAEMTEREKHLDRKMMVVQSWVDKLQRKEELWLLSGTKKMRKAKLEE